LILSKIKNYDILIKLLIITFNENLFCSCQDDCAGDKIEKNEMGWACGTYGLGEDGV